MSEEEITNEEKLQIAQHFLLSSPPGQFQEILRDVRKLLPVGILTDGLAAGIGRAFHVKNGRVVTTPSGNKAILTSAAELDPTTYVDPISQQLFTIDHLTLASTSSTKANTRLDNTLESKRSALQTVVAKYIQDKYKPENSAGGVYTHNGQLVVVICSEKPNLRNYWAGRWTSVWNVKLEGPKAIAQGEIKIHAHYFEDGNIQLNTGRPISATELNVGSQSSDIDLAENILQFIEKSETSTRASLDDMYATLNTDTLKAMRRVLPINRTKMEWNINSVRMTRQVQQKKT